MGGDKTCEKKKEETIERMAKVSHLAAWNMREGDSETLWKGRCKARVGVRHVRW